MGYYAGKLIENYTVNKIADVEEELLKFSIMVAFGFPEEQGSTSEENEQGVLQGPSNNKRRFSELG